MSNTHLDSSEFVAKWKVQLRDFARERNWEQFHTPGNLAKSVAIEAGELLECFQWNDSYDKAALEEEISDVFMYCIMLADHADIDIADAMERIFAKNAAKYPSDKCFGKSDKYTAYQDEKQ